MWMRHTYIYFALNLGDFKQTALLYSAWKKGILEKLFLLSHLYSIEYSSVKYFDRLFGSLLFESLYLRDEKS